jgi:hypothetical protein
VGASAGAELIFSPMLFYLAPIIKHHGFLAVCTRIYFLYEVVASPCHLPRGQLTK